MVSARKGSDRAIARQESALDRLRPYLEAWRLVRVGNREFLDAILAAEHRGPAEGPRSALAAWPGAHYWIGPRGRRVVLVRRLEPDPSPRWWLHLLLFLTTILCALGAGAALAGAWYPWSGPGVVGALGGAVEFFRGLGQGDWRFVLDGWRFALPFLAILLVHEMGHYLAARRYAIRATPPYFLPVPPNLSPIGGLGAFISLRSVVLDRRQLLDIGAAGPLAGGLVAVGVLAWGYLTSGRVAVSELEATSFVVFAGQPIALGESLLTWGLREWLVPGAGAVHLSLPGFAGWVGAFITGLNLLPLSQLDGGHVLYGMIGRRQAVVGVLAVIGLLVLAQFAWIWYLWVGAAFLLGGGRWSHPSVVIAAQPIPRRRQWIGWLCIAVFVATFVPIPFPS